MLQAPQRLKHSASLLAVHASEPASESARARRLGAICHAADHRGSQRLVGLFGEQRIERGAEANARARAIRRFRDRVEQGSAFVRRRAAVELDDLRHAGTIAQPVEQRVDRQQAELVDLLRLEQGLEPVRGDTCEDLSDIRARPLGTARIAEGCDQRAGVLRGRQLVERRGDQPGARSSSRSRSMSTATARLRSARSGSRR